ncbi:MAG: nucleoside transporter C-terminal domain-containing protein [Pseudomonadales bacterium]|nr:nucleoside transporter C-terminal domain-containing protein [Pseudomonadales bacterium]MDP7357693.1 nucleoside transporter C-terminal domain-containing protein [Pseudomonadales bacterium]MDP7597138.1 nucleoside transporter C-terminal domain-containing protein [Pseudomonadales bacterium]HJN48921.1 nucleoside transporter C-terminal domain-containing protein [Pseudomonadales bacterium]
MVQAILGLFVLTGIAWALSEQRRKLDWRLIVVGLSCQLLIALVMLKFPPARNAMAVLNDGVAAISSATEVGSAFVFGFLVGSADPATYPFEISNTGATFIVAFRVLPLILFFTVLSALLWHFRILPLVIRGFSYLLKRSLGVGGAVGVSTAANIFIGMVEAPVLIRPYLAILSRSELFVVMTCGMATVAGSVMILYSVILADIIPNAIGHILTASLISAPAAIMIAKIMIPGDSRTEGGDVGKAIEYHSAMDAITMATGDGLRLMVNVGAMLVVLVSLVALANSALSLLPALLGEPITLERLLGYLFAPLVWLLGIPWGECLVAGSLMGSKTVLNELIAYMQMSNLPADTLSDRSRLIMSYAMCGFANLGSLGIMIGGIGGICPERRAEIVALAPRTIISGTLATCMTGALVGLLVWE